MDNIKQKFQIGLVWSVLGQFGYLIISLLTNIILARLLSPMEFGVVAIATFFIALSKVLSESGLSGALVRKINITKEDYATIFLFNLAVSFLLYVVLFFTSSFIEYYYKIVGLGIYIKVLSIVLLLNSFQVVQNVRLMRDLEYKKISMYSLVAILISSVIGIFLAILGYGIWALIVLQILNSAFLTIIYWIREGWYFSLRFDVLSFKNLFSFGLFTTLSSLLNTFFDNIYQLVLGKYFTLGQTGFYYQAKKMSEIPVGVVKSATLGVVFSTLSRLQNNRTEFDEMYTNIVRLFTLVVGFVCLFVFLFSEEFLLLLFGNQWLGASLYLKILTLSSFFYMQEMLNRILFKVFNKTHKIFLLEIVKMILNIIVVILGVFFKSLDFLMYGYFIVCVICYFLNYYISRTVYSSKETLKELFITLKVIILITIIVLLYYSIIDFYNFNVIIKLSFVGLILLFYVLGAQLLKLLDIKKDFKLIKKFGK
ncbi:lipopolysaccharide biosynthesis protein [Myroides marinus]|uniref:lipopolysaccharide biosynthesis protein n=1 Tax=Myroides marinus TaxID=703342 RepID=UPI00257706B1|nr:lipopolysaccharide biosynthesis protein [Myroides marinus]MDM1355966.1 lipopolysaccharide biosynthesis protein [Myroides marinus]